MRSCMNLARDLGLSAQCAVADTPSGAQAFATSHHGTIVPPGEERDRLKDLSLPLLLQLEGLEPWEKVSAVENVITFFMMLGFKNVGDLSRFSLASLQERWGEIGALLWKRIHAQDQQVISPLLPTEPLNDYLHLDFPVSLVSLILLSVEKSVEFLFARLQGRRLFAQKLVLTLHCEYSKTQHRIEIEPASPSRDRDLFLTLIEQRLGNLDLNNPVHDFEIGVISCPEKIQQLDFFEPRNHDQEKMRTLLSLVAQSSIKPGFYHIEPSILPEQSWRVDFQPQETETVLEKDTEPAPALTTGHKTTAIAVTPKPRYGAAVKRAPRPTRILHKPRLIPLGEMEYLKILSTHPIERLENGWWNTGGSTSRDYHFAVSPRGECLWIFQDLKTDEYFLHGYFD